MGVLSYLVRKLRGTKSKKELRLLCNALLSESGEMWDKLRSGELSDGCHTFNELYHHRAVLFSVICHQNSSLAWKSKKHHDGSMFDGMFIVGLTLPWGQVSYHYKVDPYWNLFHVTELDTAPHYDGHTPDDSIERIGKIGLVASGDLHEFAEHSACAINAMLNNASACYTHKDGIVVPNTCLKANGPKPSKDSSVCGMSIREAASKASELGACMARRSQPEISYRATDGPECCVIMSGDGRSAPRWEPQLSDLLANDWYVLNAGGVEV